MVGEFLNLLMFIGINLLVLSGIYGWFWQQIWFDNCSFLPHREIAACTFLEVRGPKRTWMISSVTMLIVTTWRSSQMAPRRTQAWVWCHFKFFFFFFFCLYCNNSYVSITLLLCAFCQSQSQLLSILPHVPYIHTENWNCVTLLLPGAYREH